MSMMGAAQPFLEAAMRKFGIVPALEKAHFLAQLAHESMGFKVMRENLNYSAQGLVKTWPKRFDAQSAALYARQPEKIANKVYANRLGNGNEASGDGAKFLGRGYIQLTGKDNYMETSQALFGDDRLVRHPEMMEEPEHAAMAAGLYWNSRRLHVHAIRDDVEAVTRGINGGLTGLDDRKRWLAKFKVELGVSP